MAAILQHGSERFSRSIGQVKRPTDDDLKALFRSYTFREPDEEELWERRKSAIGYIFGGLSLIVLVIVLVVYKLWPHPGAP